MELDFNTVFTYDAEASNINIELRLSNAES